MVTLSGELEIEANDLENNNGMSKELRHKPRKTRRKVRDERQDSNANGKEVSPKVFKTGTRAKTGAKASEFVSTIIKKKIILNYHINRYLNK